MERPLRVEVLAPVLTMHVHCPHCETMSNQAGLNLGIRVHNQELNEYPDDWKEEYLRVSSWVRALLARYPGMVQVSLIDVQSLLGFAKVLRHRARRYPVVLLPGGERYCGWEELPRAEARIAERLMAGGTGERETGSVT